MWTTTTGRLGDNLQHDQSQLANADSDPCDQGNHDEPVENYQKRVKDYEEGRAKGKPGRVLG